MSYLILIAVVFLIAVVVLLAMPEYRQELRERKIQGEFRRLMRISPETAPNNQDDLAQSKEMAVKCIEVTAQVRTYRSWPLLRDIERKDNRPSIEWQFAYARPSSYHVRQSAWPEDLPEGEFDEWATIGTDHYETPLGTSIPEMRNERPNRFLLVDKYLEFLRTTDPISATRYRSGRRAYVLLEYKTRKVPESFRDFGDLRGVAKSGLHVWIWIDAQTALLTKAVVGFEGQSPDGERFHLEFQQVFTDFNKNISIEAPSTQFDPVA